MGTVWKNRELMSKHMCVLFLSPFPSIHLKTLGNFWLTLVLLRHLLSDLMASVTSRGLWLLQRRYALLHRSTRVRVETQVSM
jgi:hypothetical protein